MPEWIAGGEHDGIDWWGAQYILGDFPLMMVGYDRAQSTQAWPRQRSHFVFAEVVDGWRLAIEVHDVGPYVPGVDAPSDLRVAAVVAEPFEDSSLPLHNRRRAQSEMDVRRNDSVARVEVNPEFLQIFPLPGSRQPLASFPASIGERISAGVVQDALVFAGDQMQHDDRMAALPLWYSLPNPPTSKPKRGRNSRTPREWAELAAIYVRAREQTGDVNVYDWITSTFAATGQNAPTWAALMHEVAKRGYLTPLKSGQALGEMTQKAIEQIDPHLSLPADG